MTGIAITLATREDREFVGRIEKLIGHEIPSAGTRSAPEPKASKPAKSRKPAAEKRAKSQRDQTALRPPQNRPVERKEAERSPVLEDIKSDWNGPLPSFLSVSAV
jgi:superfamily II DNA/RNA helicase